MRGVDDLSRSDGCEVTVALVGEDHLVRMDAADAGCDRRSTSVRGLTHIHVHEMMGIDGAADRNDADGVAERTSLLQALHDDAVGDAVAAARTIGCIDRDHSLGRFKNCFHFPASFKAFSARSAISIEEGTIPPVRLMSATGQRPRTAFLTSKII